MPELPRRVPLYGSIFVRLLAIMVGMALCLLLLVVGFFRLVVDPGVGHALHRVLEVYAETFAAQSPDLETARAAGRRVGLTISYQGPRGRWVTEDEGPEPRSAPVPVSWGTGGQVVQAPDGGSYSFSWQFGRSMSAAHDKLLWLLLVLMLAVVLVAHEVLRRALSPVRLLYAGVSRLSTGDLDVAVPIRSGDELGALTGAFNQMAGRVREMIRLRDQLLLDVSHELRSPLTRMRVALALLPEEEKRARMESDVAEMEALITGILELERLRDRRGVRLERRDLVPLVQEAAAPFHDASPGVRLVVPSEPVLLDLDPERVRMLLRNLLDNARKYSLPDSRPVEVTVTSLPDEVEVRVRDDGPGIAEADLANVFEPFFRADRSRSRKTGGYGLGLSMCRRIAEAHGGRIVAQNHPGQGLSIVTSFPRAR